MLTIFLKRKLSKTRPFVQKTPFAGRLSGPGRSDVFLLYELIQIHVEGHLNANTFRQEFKNIEPVKSDRIK